MTKLLFSFWLLFFLSGHYLQAQNLISNGDFESYNHCPSTYSCIDYSTGYTSFSYISSWANPLATSTPDYFNVCTSNSSISVPNNIFGYRPPRSGDGYAGFYVVGYSLHVPVTANYNYREYIENKLNTPLIAGHQYAVSFYTSRAATAMYSGSTNIVAIDRLALSFSDTFVNQTGIMLALPPHIIQPGNFITDTANWTKISGVYTAHGGEQFIVIGHFKEAAFPRSAMIISSVSHPADSICYMFLDDVCVRDLTKPDITSTRDTQICSSFLPVILSLPVVANSKYLWNTGDTSITTSATIFGKFWRYTMGDCTVSIDTINVIKGSKINLSIVNNPPCFNQNNGSIILNAQNGTTPYSYALGNNVYSSNNTFTNLASGNYIIHVLDSVGCQKDANVTIPKPAPIITNITVTPALCYQDSNGSIILNTTGGTPPYTYAIGTAPPSTIASFDRLRNGTYTIHVNDANNCNKDTIVTLIQPRPLTITSLNQNMPKCYNDSSGSIIIIATGGTTPYFYKANTGAFQNADTLTKLKAGLCHIYIKDINGCMIDTSAKLSHPSQLIINIDSFKNVVCEGDKNGYVKLNAIGGTGPYAFSLSDQNHYSSTQIYNNFSEGNYTIYLKDNNLCITDTTIAFNPSHITVNDIILKNVTCFNGSDGSINLIASSPSALTYKLDNGNMQNTGLFDSLKAGTYTLGISYANNCQKDTSIILNQPNELNTIVTTTPVSCQDLQDNGTASVIVRGGTPPYSYLWKTKQSQTLSEISGMMSGNYTVLIHDSVNCRDSAIASITYDNCCKTYLPNAFSPNGDNKNNIFRIKFDGDLKLEKFYIYNRFGQIMFSTNDVLKGWDGNFNGTPQDMGTYYYYVKGFCGNKEDHKISLKGDVLLLR